MSVTLDDIAKELHVSASTVSRSLRQDPLIHPQTRARVNDMAIKMGYQGKSRRNAQNDTQTKTIGVLLCADSLAETQISLNTVGYLHGIMAEADSNGAIVCLHAVKESDRGHMDENPKLMPKMVSEHRADVIIAQGPQVESDLQLVRQKLPVVCLGRSYPGFESDAVSQDNNGGIRKLVSHLVSLGHRQLAWIGANYKDLLFDARRAGFMEGCYCNGLRQEQQIMLDDLSMYNQKGDTVILAEKGRQKIIEAARNGITGFVCANDRNAAIAVVDTLEAQGFAVPDDVSVTGFDGAEERPTNGKRITSIDPDFMEMGRISVRLALQRLERPSSREVFVAPLGRFIQGQTTSPVQSR